MRAVKLEAATIHVADRQPTFWDAVERGAWEPLTLATLRALCTPGVTFVDVGAWVGPTALLAAAAGADVIAIEADPAALEQLAANLGINPELAARVRVLPRALAARNGDVRLGARRKPGASMSSTLHADAAASWTAPSITPAELARAVPVERPLVVKIDIEGGEYDIAPHLAPLVERPRTVVLLSLHPALFAEARGPDALEAATARIFSAFAAWHTFSAMDGRWRPADAPARPGATGRATDWLFARERADVRALGL